MANLVATNAKHATRIAYEMLEYWIQVTGVVHANTSYHYELQALLDAAIALGRQSALIERGITPDPKDTVEDWRVQ